MRSPQKIDTLRERAGRHTIAALAWAAGVSEKTVANFRRGDIPKADTLKKIAAAIVQLKDGLSIATAPGPLHVDSGKPWEGRIAVADITKGKMCGWCGERHPERFRC